MMYLKNEYYIDWYRSLYLLSLKIIASLLSLILNSLILWDRSIFKRFRFSHRGFFLFIVYWVSFFNKSEKTMAQSYYRKKYDSEMWIRWYSASNAKKKLWFNTEGKITNKDILFFYSHLCLNKKIFSFLQLEFSVDWILIISKCKFVKILWDLYLIEI